MVELSEASSLPQRAQTNSAKQSPLRKMVRSLAKIPNLLFPLGLFITPFLTDIGSKRFKGCVVMNSFRTSVSTRFEQAMYTSLIIMTCYATESRSKRMFRGKEGDFVASPILNLEGFSSRNAHGIGWIVQRIVRS